MDDVLPVWVECWRHGTLLAKYTYGEAVSATGRLYATNTVHITQAENQLTTDGIAGPPFTGIVFIVRR